MKNNNKAQFDPQNSFGRLLGMTAAIMGKHLQRFFRSAGFDVTKEQMHVMFMLFEKDGRSQQDLSDCTGKDKPSITRLVDNMEKRNLVNRVASETDRRINLIYLTRKGKDLKKGLKNQARSLHETALRDISDNDIEVCRRLLIKIQQNLGSNDCLQEDNNNQKKVEK